MFAFAFGSRPSRSEHESELRAGDILSLHQSVPFVTTSVIGWIAFERDVSFWTITVIIRLVWFVLFREIEATYTVFSVVASVRMRFEGGLFNISAFYTKSRGGHHTMSLDQYHPQISCKLSLVVPWSDYDFKVRIVSYTKFVHSGSHRWFYVTFNSCRCSWFRHGKCILSFCVNATVHTGIGECWGVATRYRNEVVNQFAMSHLPSLLCYCSSLYYSLRGILFARIDISRSVPAQMSVTWITWSSLRCA